MSNGESQIDGQIEQGKGGAWHEKKETTILYQVLGEEIDGTCGNRIAGLPGRELRAHV